MDEFDIWSTASVPVGHIETGIVSPQSVAVTGYPTVFSRASEAKVVAVILL